MNEAEENNNEEASPTQHGRKIPLFSKVGRNSIVDRKSSVKPFIRTPFPTQRKKPPPSYRFHYDSTLKGWKEIPKETASARWNKAKGAVRVGGYFIGLRKKPNTVLNIDVKSLVRATAQNRSLESARKMNEDPEIESLQRTLTDPGIYPKPFVRGTDQKYDGVWTYPVDKRPSEECNKAFEWERPKTDRKNLVESASKYQAQYLQKLLKEKDKEIKLISYQLVKINKENVSLLKELDGFRGRNYDELYKENVVLKEQVARISRENNVLVGQVKKDNNLILKKWASRDSADMKKRKRDLE